MRGYLCGGSELWWAHGRKPEETYIIKKKKITKYNNNKKINKIKLYVQNIHASVYIYKYIYIHIKYTRIYT